MDGRGRFLDNIFIERLWRSLKYEAVYLHELRDGLDAERIVGTWVDFYNEVTPALVAGRPDAGRGLPRWSDNIVTTILARRPLRGATGATTPASVAGSPRAGSLRLPIGSRSRREDGGWV